MAEVKIRKGPADEMFDRAVRKFKKLVEKEGLLKDLERHKYFMTKRQRRRLQKKRSIRRIKRERLKNVERN